jgi:hypothetical protein
MVTTVDFFHACDSETMLASNDQLMMMEVESRNPLLWMAVDLLEYQQGYKIVLPSDPVDPWHRQHCQAKSKVWILD